MKKPIMYEILSLNIFRQSFSMQMLGVSQTKIHIFIVDELKIFIEYCIYDML